jgi:cytidyltransferase-like protein
MSEPIQLGVYVGRFCPPHEGHCRVIRCLLDECGLGNCLVLLGSSNHALTYRHLFSLEDRVAMLQRLFPGLNLVGIPDHDNDASWLADLWTLIGCWRYGREEPTDRHVTFYGGCEEDILFFVNAGYAVEILNRFDGSSPKVSATEVRDALVHGRDVRSLIPAEIHDLVAERFALRWEELKRR